MLPEGFIFSQSSLQDYVDCARRFQLRYLEHCRWPAPETADVLEFERLMQGGHAFHRLLRQLYSSVPRPAVEAVASSDAGLSRWWANYCAAPPQNLPDAVQEAEVTLSAPVARLGPGQASYRIEARYDLLAGKPGERWVIVDWKTAQHRSSRAWLRQRLQTRIYPFVLVQAGSVFNEGMAIAPHQVEMLYWFAEFPAQPELFTYNSEALAADAAYLEVLVREIAERASRPHEFSKAEDRPVCCYCVYRSLCWEDVCAGPLAEADDLEGLEASLEDIDLESIVPIPF